MSVIGRECAECGLVVPEDLALRWTCKTGERWTCAMCEVERLEAQLAGAVSGTPEGRIADVLHSIGFGAERHDLARRMLKLAQDAHAGGQ